MEPQWDGGRGGGGGGGGRHNIIQGPGLVTKMAAVSICGKNHLKIFSETSRLITFELGIQHQGLLPYKVHSNDGPGLALTEFVARSTLLPNDFA